MRKLLSHKHGQMAMVGAAIGLFITLIISVLVYYNISASVYDTTTVTDAMAKTTKGQAINASVNATTSINNQAETFYIIAPIVAVVIVAVVIIGYVQRIGG